MRTCVPTRNIILVCFFSCLSLYTYGQSCDCPAITSCGTCQGGLISLTLRYTGGTPQNITAEDQVATVFTGVINPGATFSFVGSIPNEKFVGPDVELTVGGSLNATIPSICGSVFVGNTYGDFVIVDADSKTGGPLCCSAASMETVAPQITGCPSNVTVNLPPSACTVAGGWTPPLATDNCSVTSFLTDVEPTDPLPVGPTTVTYTATDKYGNTATCSFDVTVVDNTAPIISACPADIVIEASSCDQAVSWTPPDASDNCSVTLTSTHEAGDVFEPGTTTITYTATDPSGNVATCSFNVTVEDTSAPVFSNCPSNITIDSGTACDAVVSWTRPVANDNCSVTLTSTHEPGNTFAIGTSTITYTATDESGNSSTCSFQVTVATTVAPAVTGCPDDITVHTFDEAVLVSWTPPEATAVCGTLVSDASHSPDTEFEAGNSEVVYEFNDGTGNGSVCAFNVNVIRDEISFEVAKVITPNGDGINDTWWVTNIEKFKDNSVLIVDRWGSRIYKSSGYDNIDVQWNAAGPGGGRVPIGTYFYTIEVKTNDRVVRDSGFVEVVY